MHVALVQYDRKNPLILFMRTRNYASKLTLSVTTYVIVSLFLISIYLCLL